MRVVFADQSGQIRGQVRDCSRVIRFKAVIVRRTTAFAIHPKPDTVTRRRSGPANLLPRLVHSENSVFRGAGATTGRPVVIDPHVHS